MPTATRTDGYAPLRSYAMLGDMRGSALVACDGAIDWLAVPAMDAPPVCAALLDPAAGGSIELTPTVPFEVSRCYLDATLVLESTFTTATGDGESHRCTEPWGGRGAALGRAGASDRGG